MENFLDMSEFADVLNQLENIEDTPEEMDEEALASKRRYEEIIKKHKE